MKVAIIYNKDLARVINQFGMQNKEKYNPKTAMLEMLGIPYVGSTPSRHALAPAEGFCLLC